MEGKRNEGQKERINRERTILGHEELPRRGKKLVIIIIIIIIAAARKWIVLFSLALPVEDKTASRSLA